MLSHSCCWVILRFCWELSPGLSERCSAASTRMGERHPRRISAMAVILLPPLLVGMSWIAWSPGIPDEIGSHWSGPGPADRTTPSGELFRTALIVSTVASLVGFALMLLRTVPPTARTVSVLGAGSVSAIAAAQWLVTAWITIEAGSADRAVMGAWILVHFAVWAYGVIPMALLPSQSPAPNDRSSRMG